MAADFAGKRILVTGGSGFLGSHVVATLRARGATDVTVPRSAEFDLCDAGATRRLFETARPDLVFHLAAKVGGIVTNRRTFGPLLPGVDHLPHTQPPNGSFHKCMPPAEGPHGAALAAMGTSNNSANRWDRMRMDWAPFCAVYAFARKGESKWPTFNFG